ncbi:MAG: methyl-accepting chemotaxis protein [Bacillota bacterium]|nr:methyl-accepting chemotaxis protein [Bacillota bacterium]
MKLFQNTKFETKLTSCCALLILISAFGGFLSYLISRNAAIAVTFIFFIAIASIGIIRYIILNDLVKPVKEIQNVLSAMEVNDYTIEVQGSNSGAMKEISSSVNNVRMRLLSVQDALIKVSKGDFSRLEEFERIGKRSDNDNMMPAVSGMMRIILNIIIELDSLNKSASEGNLNVRGETNKFSGDYRRIIDGFNNTLNIVVEPLNESIKVLSNFALNDFTVNMTGSYKGSFKDFADAINDMQKQLLSVESICNNISNGDMGDLVWLEKTGKRSQNDKLIPSFTNMIKVIQDLSLEVDKLIQASLNGDLTVRGQTDKFKGKYKNIVEGINRLLECFIDPLNEVEFVMKKMYLNDYTTEVTGQYKGKFKEFADSINSVRARLLSVQDAFVRVSVGDTSRLDEFKKIGKRSENDQLMPACTEMMQAIQDLIDEADILATAALNGELSLRGNAVKFHGGYKSIIEGMNRTMDAVYHPIHEATNVMQEMAKGNLNLSMDGDYKGDYLKIKDSLNFAIKSFNDILTQINTSAQQVASGSSQISDSAQALSQGSTEQASSIEELSASIEEISSQTKQNADNADKARNLAETAMEKAVQGNNQMKEMLKAMEDINDASSNISKIIKVIDEIAFQTNILALNAAVEAARAGQHGKGFAVVAEEVRNLAARSADAAKETTVMIEDSIKKVEGGAKIAKYTADALNVIVDDVSKAAVLVGEIATASNQQAVAVLQINQGVIQVSEVVQTNSATSQESAAASEELSSQAETLRGLADKFTLRKNTLSFNQLEELSPDILRLLENINDNKKTERNKKHEPHKQKDIILSDKEFGKY